MPLLMPHFFEVLFNNSESIKHRPDSIHLNAQKLITRLSCGSVVAWLGNMQIRGKDRKLNIQSYWCRTTLCLFVFPSFFSSLHCPVHCNLSITNPWTSSHHSETPIQSLILWIHALPLSFSPSYLSLCSWCLLFANNSPWKQLWRSCTDEDVHRGSRTPTNQKD